MNILLKIIETTRTQKLYQNTIHNKIKLIILIIHRKQTTSYQKIVVLFIHLFLFIFCGLPE